ncbi:hypothetical protein [Sedimenticola thiotaurini]|nr:hypothetical protein [Sedimenticola thiotaurini]
MIIKNNTRSSILPVYEVKELSMEEALLVLAADKESMRPQMPPETGDSVRHCAWSGLASADSAAA